MFTVTDDGPGFDPAVPVTGSGLRNMSDRLAALGGSCEVDSRPGRGTTVTGRIGFGGAPAGSGDRVAGPAPAESGCGVPLAGRMG